MSHSRLLYRSFHLGLIVLGAVGLVLGAATIANAQDDGAPAPDAAAPDEAAPDEAAPDEAEPTMDEAAPEMDEVVEEAAEAAWYDEIDISGNFRFRGHWQRTENGLDNSIPGYGLDRFRLRYRMYLDAAASYDEFDFGFRLGTSGSSTSTNETYDNAFANGGLFVRRAYAATSLADDVTAVFGRFAPPKERFFRSILTLDSDIALTGIALMATLQDEAGVDGAGGTQIYANLLGLWLVEEAAGAGREDVFGIIFGLFGQFDSLAVGLNFWGILHAATNVPNFTNADPDFRSNFTALDFSVQYKSGDIKFFGQAVFNLGASETALDAADENNLGFIVGVANGSHKKVGDAKVELKWYYLEVRAWAAGLSDADAGNGFGQGTMLGTWGIEVNWRYHLMTDVKIGMEINVGRMLYDQIPDADDFDGYMSVIFDIYFDF